jgi:hypothetical protein
VKLKDLLAKIPEDCIWHQPLAECLKNIRFIKSGVYEISFLTNALTPSEVVTQTGKVGLIVWIDRDQWNKAFDSCENPEPRKDPKKS